MVLRVEEENKCINEAPKSVRGLFRDPCIRVAGEVSKVLSELATSIKQYQCFPPNILSDQLHEALQDLNSVITSQPRLFLGSTNGPKIISGKEKERENTFTGFAPPSAKADISGMLTWWRKKAAGAESKNSGQQKKLRHTLSRTVIPSLEFSEALPFAAFASLLVEMVARLDLVIQEVEELGRAANFMEHLVSEECIVIDSRNHGRFTFDAV
ncbi:uncharacterized protein A4U43_C04F16930 [Asparagus officinalis]|uniref:Aluminum-activated malate transporter n=1 Tax=Asparagus officinalis TaxID=4686 RepID=A0A5P1F1H4_ASPOF|nr:uncharacterized protein A4U43_C04F16930 [Asparagus officinalis]